MKIIVLAIATGTSTEELRRIALGSQQGAIQTLEYIRTRMPADQRRYALLMMTEPELIADNAIRKMVIDAIGGQLPNSQFGDETWKALIRVNQRSTADDAVSLERIWRSGDAQLAARAAAVIFMSPSGSYPMAHAIAGYFGLTGPLDMKAEKKRNQMFQAMREAEDRGIRWDNYNSGVALAMEGNKNMWNGTAAERAVKELNYFPLSFVQGLTKPDLVMPRGTPIANPPSALVKELKDKIAKTAHKNMESIEDLSKLGSLYMSDSISLEVLVNNISNFIASPHVNHSEKLKLAEDLNGLEALVGCGHTREKVKDLVWLNEKDIYAILMKSFLSAKHFDCIWAPEATRALTSNLDLALPYVDDIVAKLKKHNVPSIRDVTSEQFADFVETIEAIRRGRTLKPKPGEHMEHDTEETDIYASLEWDATMLKYSMEWTDKRKAIFMAFLAVAFNLMTIGEALQTFRVSGSEVASNADLAEKAETAMLSRRNEEFKAQVQREIEEAKQKALLEGPSKPKRPTWYRKLDPSVKTPQTAEITRDLVKAIESLEHDPNKDVSSKGAAGRMQIMKPTWEELNKKHFNGKYPWGKYRFDDNINMMFAIQHLRNIKAFLDSNRHKWKTDQVPLIFAAYFGGIGNLERLDYDPRKIAKHAPLTFDYMTRGSNLLGHTEIRTFDRIL